MKKKKRSRTYLLYVCNRHSALWCRFELTEGYLKAPFQLFDFQVFFFQNKMHVQVKKHLVAFGSKKWRLSTAAALDDVDVSAVNCQIQTHSYSDNWCY